MRFAFGALVGWLAWFAGSASAHFSMLLPQSASVKKGEEVTITYQWGHPFEHQLFDAPQPESVILLTPDGKRADLTDKLEKTARKNGSKDVTAYQLHFTPPQRGDYIFVLRSPPLWMGEESVFFQDTVRMVLHVQVQQGWDTAESEFDFVPLTRPYGLRPGMVFQAQLARASGLVEIERYNAEPPKKLPADEHITRTVKLDPNGVATTTLPDAGWWCLTYARTQGTRAHEGKSYPLRQRSTVWVFVDEPASRD
jgi:uncharacterized GH25 family protein